jgi:hypothetical protein
MIILISKELPEIIFMNRFIRISRGDNRKVKIGRKSIRAFDYAKLPSIDKCYRCTLRG